MTEQEQVSQQAVDQSSRDEEDLIEEKARLWEQGDWKGVIALYEEVALDPEQNGESDWLGELSRGLEEYGGELPGDDERAQAWMAIGELRMAVGDDDGAVKAYRRAFEYDPQDPMPLELVRNIYEDRGEWEVMVDLCDAHEALVSSSDERASILTIKAQVQGEYLGDRGAAIDTLEAVLECGVEDPFVDQILGFYMEDRSLEQGLEAALERAEEALNEERAEEACEAFIEATQLEYDRFGGSTEEALRLVTMALEAHPDSEDAALIAQELMEEVEEGESEQSMTTEDDVSEEVRAEESDQERSVEALLEGVEAMEGSLEEVQAEAKRERTDLSALKRLRQHWMDEGNLGAWAEWLDNSIRYFRKKEGEWELMTELANLYWLELGEDDQAEYYFKRLKLIDDNHPDVFKFYEAYYEQEGDFLKLFNLLANRLEHLDDREDQRLVVERMADMAEHDLDNPGKAIDVWKKFSRRFPEDEEAIRRLRHLYEDHGKWNALVDLLQEEIRGLDEDSDPGGDRRVSLLEERAHIYRSQLGVESTLMRILGEILEVDPDHPSAFGELRDLFESKRRFNDLASLLSERAERCLEREDVATAVGYLRDVADLWEEELNNQTQAIPYLERIVEIDPGDRQTRQRLREVYEKRRDFKSLFDLRVAEAGLLGQEEQEAELEALREMAREKLSDRQREARVLEELRELRVDDREVLEALEAIRRQQEKWPEVATLLERRAELAEADEAKVELLWESATLWDAEGERERAVELWRQVLRLAGDHEEAFEALDEHMEGERDWEGIVALYEESGEYEGLVDRLQELSEAYPDSGERLLEERVRIFREVMESPSRVVEALEVLLEVAAEPGEIRRRLLDWYPKVGALDEEIETREVLLEGLEDEEERAEAMRKLADLEEEREEWGRALDWVLAWLELKSDDLLLERATRLSKEAARVEDLVVHLDEWALDWEGASLEMSRIAAGLVDQELEDLEGAIERYESLHEEYPTEMEWLEVLERLYEEADQPQQRMEVLKKQLQVLREEGAAEIELVDLLGGVADIQRGHLGDLQAARESYSQILDMQPDHLGALRGKKELYRAEGRWEDVVDYLSREIPLAAMESPEQAWEAKIELAELYRLVLEERGEALRYYGEVLGEDPEHETALEAVRELLADDELAREAALLLEPIFRQSEQAAPLAEALEARLRLSEDPYEEQEILDELIPLYADELEETEVAFEYAQRQFSIDPERDDIWLRVEQLGAALDKWELLEEMFSEESPLQGHESSTRYDLLRHLAAIREHRLQKPGAALEAWEKLHDYDPLDLAVVEALERLYRTEGEPQELAEVLAKRAELVESDEDRVELWLEAATLCLEELEERDEAETHLRRVLQIEAEHHGAVEMLVVVLEAQQRWHDLDELLTDQAMQTLDPERRRSYRRRLARLRYEEVADFAGAVEILKDLLDDDPGDDEVLAFAQQADALLEEEGHRNLRLDLHRTLEPLYRMRGEAALLNESLELRLEHESGHFEKVEILDELVELRQKRLSDPRGALDALQQAVIVDPEDEVRRKKMLEIASGLDALVEGLDVLEEAAQGADSFVALDIWKRLGKLASQKVNDPKRAIRYYEEARRLDDSDRALLEALERLFESTGQSDELCANLLEQSQFAVGAEREALLRRAATLQHHVLEEQLDAISTYQQLLEINADDLSAMASLEELYKERDEYLELLAIYRRKVELLDSEEKVELFEQWARIAEEELGDVAQAIEIRRRLLEIEPDHGKSLEELSRLLKAELEWGPWTEVMERRLELWTGDDSGLMELEFELARVCGEELYDGERAVEIYRGIIAREGAHHRAVEALEELAQEESWLEELSEDLVDIYRQEQRWSDLVELLERRASLAMDRSRQAILESRRGEIFRDQLEEPSAALASFGRAWRLDIEAVEYVQKMIEVGQEAGLWRDLVDGVEEGLDEVMDPEQSRELRLMLVQWWRDELDDSMEAEGHLRRLIERDPTDPEAFPQLSELLEVEARWFDLVDLLEQRHDAVIGEDPDQGVELLMAIAELQRDPMDDAFSAVETLRRVRQVEERHQEATELLETLLREQERWEDLEQFYRELAEQTPLPSERLEAEMALAALYRGPLERPRQAVELYGAAIEIDADHEGAIEALEEIFEEVDSVRVQAAECLEPVYRSRGEVAGLVEILLTKAQATEVVDERGPWLCEALQLLREHLHEPKRAWAVAADRFSDCPDDEETRKVLFELTRQAGAWEVVAELLETCLNAPLDMEVAVRGGLRRQLAEIHVDRLGHVAKGREQAETALELVPESDEAIALVERILQRQRAWHDLAEYYRRRAEYAVETELSRHWYEKLAALYEDVIDDVDATVQVYARLLELAPGDERYRSAMERILATVERWYDLADIYRQRIAGEIETDVVRKNRLALAGLLERELESPEEAISIYERVLDEEPGHSDAIRALEGMRRDLEVREGDWRLLRRKIIDILLEAYDDSRAWRRIDDLLDERVELCDDPADQVDLLVDKAQLVMRSTQDMLERVHALTTLARAFCLQPRNEEISELIEMLADDLDAWQRVVPIYLRSLGGSDDVDQQGHILAAVARIYEEKIGDTESAVAAYQQSVEISMESELAIAKLEELYTEMEKYEPLVEILERRLEEVYDTDRQRSLRKRVARVCDEKLRDPNRALIHYRELRRETPEEMTQIVVVERLLESIGDYGALEDLLLEKLQYVDTPHLRAKAFRRLGEIRRDYLERVDDAIGSFRDARKAYPEDDQALDALMDLYRREERWHHLLDTLSELREQSKNGDEVDELTLQMGDIYREEVGDSAAALSQYEAVLERDSENFQARGALFQLLNDEEVSRQAASTLVEIHRQAGEWEELEALYQRLVETSDDVAFKGEQYLELAKLQEREIGVAFKAFATLSEAMNEVASVQAVREELERLAEELGSSDDLVVIYEEALEAGVEDEEARRSLHRKVGQGRAQGEDFDRAIEHLEAVLAIDEFDEVALDWLDKIYQELQQWQSLMVVLEKKLLVASGEKLRQTQFQLGYLREVVQEDLQSAFELYREVLLEAPDHQGAIEGLERLCADRELRGPILELLEPTYGELGDWAKLARLYALKLEVIEEESQQAQLLRKLATLELEELGEPDRAFEHWAEAFKIEPHDGELEERLRILARDYDLFHPTVSLFVEVCESLDDDHRRLELASQAGEWAELHIGDQRLAARAYRHVLDVDPTHQQALGVLEKVAREEGDPESLGAVLSAKLELSDDPQDRLELLRELATVQLQGDDAEGAIESLEALQDVEGFDRDRLETLAGLYAQSGDSQKRADALETLIDGEEEQPFDWLVELAELSVYDLDDAKRARKAFEQAREVEANHPRVIRGLTDVYEALDDWELLEAILGRQLELVASGEWDDDEVDRGALRMRRGALRDQKADDGPGAVEDYRQALELGVGDEAFEALSDVFERHEGWEELLQLWEWRIDQEEFDHAVERLMEMSSIAELKLEDRDRAVDYVETVFNVVPEHAEALDRLERLHREGEDWRALVGLIERRIEMAEGDEVHQWWVERATVLDEKAKDKEAAAEAYRDLIAKGGQDDEIDGWRKRLRELYEEVGDGEGLYGLLEAQLDEVDEEGRCELYLEMAKVAKTHLGDEERRVQALESARAIAGDELTIVEPLLDAYIDAQAFDRATPLLESVIETLSDARKMKDAVRFIHLRGKLTEQQGDSEAALEAYNEAQRVDATYIPNMLSRGRLLLESGDHEGAKKNFQVLLLHHTKIKDPAKKVEMYYHLGEARRHLGEERGARDMYKRALRVDSDHEPSQEGLELLGG